MSDNPRQEASNAIKDFIQTISPFVSLAIGLIGLIYANQMKDNQASTNKMVDKMDKIEATLNEVKNGQYRIDSKLERHDEINADEDKAIKDLQTRQNDLEKTVILSNATRK